MFIGASRTHRVKGDEALSETNETLLDLVWEVDAIAKLIGRSDRQTFHLLSTGELPAKKVGGRWVVERGTLRNFFLDTAK
jgi:hypothetical protein